MKTPNQFYQGAYDYLFVIFLGIPFTFLYNVVAGIIRSLGDSKTPFYFLVLSAVMNIFLDMLFIIVFKHLVRRGLDGRPFYHRQFPEYFAFAI